MEVKRDLGMRCAKQLLCSAGFLLFLVVGLLQCREMHSPQPVPSIMAIASRQISIDVQLLRWLWWPIILYLFWGMAHVCDIYFVSSIDVMSKRFKIPDDVAGATLMALGCNGPELSLNTIAIFQPSNIGVGAVIGGEVFNVLVIIGTALLATPEEYMPLQLGKFSFMRDVVFYIISVLLLYHALHDQKVTLANVMLLLVGAVVYILTVIYSTSLRRFFSKKSREQRLAAVADVGDSIYSTLSDRSEISAGDRVFRMSPMLNPKTNQPDPEKVAYWKMASNCKDPFSGTVLRVRVDLRNRLMDRGHRADTRFVVLLDSGLMVSTLIDPRTYDQAASKCASGMVYQQRGETDTGWHHGGLVGRPMHLQRREPSTSQMAEAIIRGQMHLPQMFCGSPWEVIPLEDIIWMDRPVDRTCFNLHVHMPDSDLAQLTPVATLEFIAQNEEIVGAWAEALKEGLLKHRGQRPMGPPQTSASGVALAWLEWLQFPIKSFTSLTVPDVSLEDSEHLYPLAFVMSMAWLAVFAYLVVAACDGIHEDFGISTSVLGYTVAAAGTSFPNVFSGMCVARQGKTTMAVANALGANVQNVFLALAIPWTIQCAINRGSFEMPFVGLGSAVVEIYVTLFPVLLVFCLCDFRFPRWSGWLFLGTYAIYLCVALTQDTQGCPSWPFTQYCQT